MTNKDRFEAGWLVAARHCPSPNFDELPQRPELIVIHCISLPPKEYGGDWIQRLFLNQIEGDEHPSFASLQGVRVSAHFYIDRNGTLTQFVPINKRAWHAGQSSYLGRENCNDFSLGIELEGDDESSYSDAQYDTLSNLVNVLLNEVPTLSADRIAAHSEIAPGRKTDPGPGFDWSRFRKGLNA
ncbi:MAG: 1,6-anhydro-N-acetylmuramyl-L-alanine amidase AmpD [Gammaproteobacteria bacterium]|nr:1,6-anhydro-N-acetylmuramyl-L-alanine amidase AmpD [Gammaproteobacteria bacterium]